MYHVQDFDIHIATFKAITVFPRIISRSNNPPPPKRCPPHRPCMHIWNIKQVPLVNKLSLPPGLEILWTSNDGDDWMGANIKTQRNPSGFLQNSPKNPKQKLTPQKSHTEFLSLKNLQKALNDITRKIWITEIECLCLFIHHTIWTFRLLFYPKKSLLKSSHPRRNAHQLLLPKKIPILFFYFYLIDERNNNEIKK